jgi:hypothetical protein
MAIYALQQALYTTHVQELRLVDMKGSTSQNSMAMIHTLVTSMVCHPDADDEINYHAAPGMATLSSFTCCPIESLTFKTQLTDVLDDDYLCSVHAILAQYLPQMPHLQKLHCRWHPTTSALLYKAIQANTSLVWVDSGKAVGRMLEPVLQRNRLLQATQDFCQSAHPMNRVLEFAQHHGLWEGNTTNKNKNNNNNNNNNNNDQVTGTAAFWLVRACLPPNIATCCGNAGVDIDSQSSFLERYLQVNTMDWEHCLDEYLSDVLMMD